jgi:hypothetical protein
MRDKHIHQRNARCIDIRDCVTRRLLDSTYIRGLTGIAKPVRCPGCGEMITSDEASMGLIGLNR